MAEPFRNFGGIVAPLPQPNIDTDAILPSAWLRAAHRDFSGGLFAMMRRDAEGRSRVDFPLNQPRYRGASILLAGDNFGCGSSREAAVWALVHSGFRCVLAPGFSDIFSENAFLNGLLAGRILAADLATMAEMAEGGDQAVTFFVNLETCTVETPGGSLFRFEIAPERRSALLRGDDQIALTLQHNAEIEDFYARACRDRPWVQMADGEEACAEPSS